MFVELFTPLYHPMPHTGFLPLPKCPAHIHGLLHFLRLSLLPLPLLSPSSSFFLFIFYVSGTRQSILYDVQLSSFLLFI